MCFGVRDAIALAQQQAQKHPLTVLGDLVHNETVLQDLRARGVQIAQHTSEVQTADVMITAHGAAERTIAQARSLGFQVTEATCPLVHHAHRAVRNLARAGYHPVIIGRRDHVEVRGLTGDLDSFDVVLSESDVYDLQPRSKFGVAAQTTQPIGKVMRLVEAIRARFPDSEVRFVDTVCRPTKDRQESAEHLARQSDVVVVIGGAVSNNTHELVRTCAQYCARVHHVQTASDLRPEWFDHARVVGITAGTSTPDSSIDEVEHWLNELALHQGPQDMDHPHPVMAGVAHLEAA
jgi:4-hydroxy-3-methylbut-2-enyl diphosphate reductase